MSKCLEWRLAAWAASRVLIVFSAAWLVAGCAVPEQAPENAPEMIVTRQFTPFYTTSPMQTRGPDASLPQDERVRLLSRDFGFSLVQLPDGRKGYVPSDNLAPAPPLPPKPKKRDGAPTRGFDPLPEIFDDAPLPDFGLPPIEIPDPILLDEEVPAPQKKNERQNKEPSRQNPDAPAAPEQKKPEGQTGQTTPPSTQAGEATTTSAAPSAEQTPASPPADQSGN